LWYQLIQDRSHGQGEVTDRELVLTAKNGSRRTVLYNWLPQRDAGGKLVQILGFGDDITERKQAEEDLRCYSARFWD